MQIKGFIGSSLIDWDGKITAVIFLSKCNFQCKFCHNKELLEKKQMEDIPFDMIKEYLLDNKNFIDGVVITGGEPTLNKHLKELCIEIKKLNLKIKLDTNGSRPKVVKTLIKRKLIDYIAVDIKTVLDPIKYEELTGFSDIDKIKETMEIIKNSEIDHEYRTTVIPKYHPFGTIIDIAKSLEPKKCYALQSFKPEHTLDPKLSEEKPYTQEELNFIRLECTRYIPVVKTRY